MIFSLLWYSMKISQIHLGFIGFGHMAQIIFKAIDRAKIIPRSQIFFNRRSPEKIRKNEMEFGITSTTLETIQKRSDLLILAVRPHQVDEVLKEISSTNKMFISIAAGIKLSAYQKFPLALRVMPNVASEVGEGMSVLSYAEKATDEFRSLGLQLFGLLGQVAEIDESLMDVACAIAGSGPGFVFKLIQEMALFGQKKGMSFEEALKMAAQSFFGAAKLILKGKQVNVLLEQIATPNGTTEAGLNMMDSLQMGEHFQRVLDASYQRSKSLS